MPHVTVTCPGSIDDGENACDQQIDVDYDYDAPDRSVGYSGGLSINAWGKEPCPNCGEMLDLKSMAEAELMSRTWDHGY